MPNGSDELKLSNRIHLLEKELYDRWQLFRITLRATAVILAVFVLGAVAGTVTTSYVASSSYAEASKWSEKIDPVYRFTVEKQANIEISLRKINDRLDEIEKKATATK